MDSDKVGDLYFQKAESTRVTQRAFEGGGILGIIFTMATLVISADDSVADLSVLIVFMSVSIAVLTYARFYYDMSYNEYRTNYISYYAVNYVEEYMCDVLREHSEAELKQEDVEAIVHRMCADLGFEKSSTIQGVRVCLARMQENTRDSGVDDQT